MTAAIDDGERSVTLERESDGAFLHQAWGAIAAVDEYRPDIEAYKPDPANDRAASLRRALEGAAPPVMTISAIAYDGMRESIELSAYETRAYLEADLSTRETFKRTMIRESRARLAIDAARRIREGQFTLDALVRSETPLAARAEAALREFDAIAETAIKRLREGDVDGSLEKAEVRDETAFALRESFVETNPIALAERQTLREDFSDSWNTPAGASTSDSFNAFFDREWKTAGQPAAMQLQLNDVWDSLSKCQYAFSHDPIGKECILLIRDFVVGRGVQVRAKDTKVQAVLEAFDDANDMANRLEAWAIELSRDGELFTRLLKQPVPKSLRISDDDPGLRVRSLPPGTIWEIVHDPEDIEAIERYVQRYMSPSQTFVPRGGIPQKWIERDLPADELIHLKVNVDSQTMRGRSDLFAALGYLKMLRDLGPTIVAKEQALAAYYLDVAVKGNKTAVQAFMNDGLPKGRPNPGSAYVHNDAVTITTLDSGKRGGGANGGENPAFIMLVTLVAIACGLSKDYLGVTTRGSRATALVATEPVAMRLEQRQNVLERLLRKIYRWVIRTAKSMGLIPAGADETFSIKFPEIQRDEVEQRIKQLALGESMGWWSKEYAATHAAQEMGDSGFDFDAQQEKLTAELEDDAHPGKWLMASQYGSVVKGDTAQMGTPFAEPDFSGADDPNAAPAEDGRNPVTDPQPPSSRSPHAKQIGTRLAQSRTGSERTSPSSRSGGAAIRRADRTAGRRGVREGALRFESPTIIVY